MVAVSGQQKLGLEVSRLRVTYDGFTAVADTSFRVAPGESFGIVGESGSGKSTVLRAICGLAPKVGGTVKLIGNDAATSALPAPGSKAFRRRVQMVFQDPYGSLHPRQTVDRILAEPLAIHKVGDAETRIERALDEVGDIYDLIIEKEKESQQIIVQLYYQNSLDSSFIIKNHGYSFPVGLNKKKN